MDRTALASRLRATIEGSEHPVVSTFGDRAGIARATLYNYLKGVRVPDVEQAQRIAEVGGVSVQWLHTGREPAPAAGRGGAVLAPDEQALLAAYRAAGPYQQTVLLNAQLRAAELLAQRDAAATSGTSPPDGQRAEEGATARRAVERSGR